MIGVTVAVFLIAPDAVSGGTYLVVRLAALPADRAAVLDRREPISRQRFDQVSRALCAAGAVSALILLGVHVWKYAQVNPYAREMEPLAADVTPNSTLLPVDLSEGNTLIRGKQKTVVFGIDPFLHIVEYNLAERGVVQLKNAWAITGYHPLRYRDDANPYQEDRPTMDLQAYPIVHHRPIDYVLVWTGGQQLITPQSLRLRRQLATSYELIARSAYSGYGELYRRKDFNPNLASSSSAALRGGT